MLGRMNVICGGYCEGVIGVVGRVTVGFDEFGSILLGRGPGTHPLEVGSIGGVLVTGLSSVIKAYQSALTRKKEGRKHRK